MLRPYFFACTFPRCTFPRHDRPETIPAPGGRTRHGRRHHGGVGDLPHARPRGRAAGAPVAHFRRLDRGRGPRAARRVVLRRARDAPPGSGREVRVRARGVRPARRLRGGVGRGTGDLSRRDRGDRGGCRRVHRPARGPRGGPHALGWGWVGGAVHGDQSRWRRVGALGAEPRYRSESAGPGWRRGARVRPGRRFWLALDAPGGATLVAVARASQAVIWTYYGYLDVAKIAEEVVDPGRTLPRILLGGIGIAAALYLLLNASFFQVLPIDRIAASNLAPGDVAAELTGARGGTLVAALAVLVVLASLNGNIFVTPRVIFGLARDGLGPSALALVNAGGTPWVAMLLVGAVALALAATGSFESLLGLAITVILVIDSFTVLSLFRLRARQPRAPFLVPWFPWVPLAFVGVYAALFVGTALGRPGLVAKAGALLVGAYGMSWTVEGGRGR